VFSVRYDVVCSCVSVFRGGKDSKLLVGTLCLSTRKNKKVSNVVVSQRLDSLVRKGERERGREKDATIPYLEKKGKGHMR
jgi:hypothetical protein